MMSVMSLHFSLQEENIIEHTNGNVCTLLNLSRFGEKGWGGDTLILQSKINKANISLIFSRAQGLDH